MNERAVYNSEDGHWYREGETPWVVRNAERGETVIPFFNVTATAYTEAFEALYDHAVVYPPNPRFIKPEVLA